MNSLWLIIVALAAFAVAYRLYGAFLAAKVAVINDARATPAHRLADGVDYHPTSRLVLFGQHFAAIAGPGPLIGPVLAAQWGFLPGFTWIIVGACLAGGVHDFVILLASVRQDGLSLQNIARKHIGPVAGVTVSLATLFIIIIILASVATVVVNALSDSPWGIFTVAVTIPAALLTGLWMYRIRPGKVAEASVIGVTIVLAGVYLGQPFAASHFAHYLKFDRDTLALMLPIYAFIASILPVWLLMCPRDYLSSYMKIGVVVVLAVGILVVHPTLKMPATTLFIHGGGPVVSGSVWPFVCIVIMCGALSGFHALIASGTTPKMINRESDIRAIGYGAMVVEGFVAVTALVAACSLEPSDYFAINVPQTTQTQRNIYNGAIERAADQGWDVKYQSELPALEQDTRETLRNKPGGAVTLAVGMAKVFSSAFKGLGLMDYWYHFIIMFEALFILTLLETGTRVTRFVFQETAAQFLGGVQPGGKTNWAMNVAMSMITCAAWGWLLYVGNLATLWKMLGIANQLLATIALAIGTTYLLKHAPKRRYALCAALPLAFTIATVGAAGVISVREWWKLAVLADKPVDVFLYRFMSVMGVVMMVMTAVITIDAVRRWILILREGEHRLPPQVLPELALGQTK